MKDAIPTDNIFIRLLKAHEYIEHFELSVLNELYFTEDDGV